MSDQDDTLLDEDLGDEEYDLGNDEEEALLADDCDIDRQNSYKGEEETDDVLDLGVTDALDDLDGDDENVEFRNDTDNYNQSHCYNEQNVNCHYNYYEQEEHIKYNEEHNPQQHYDEENIGTLDPNVKSNIPLTGDLREKLQKNVVQRNVLSKSDCRMEDDDGEEAKERRNRFQNERTIISPKMNNKIPDSLENVVTTEQTRPVFRGRGRGRGTRIRGGRFSGQINFNPRFGGRGQSYEEQNPQFRPAAVESRPPLFPNGPPNMINVQLMYPQSSHLPQHSPHPPRFQQYPQGPPRPIGQHYNEPGIQAPYNQFNQVVAQGPRLSNPRMEFRPRAPGPRFSGPPTGNPPAFIQPQISHYQPGAPRLSHGPERHPLPPGNHEQMMPGAPGGSSLLGLPPHPADAHPPPPRAQGPPMHSGHPPQVHAQDRPNGLIPQGYPRPPAPPPNHGPPGPIPNHPNAPQHQQAPLPPNAQQNFNNNRMQFQGPQFEGSNMYNVRVPFNNPPGVSQFNNPVNVGHQPQTSAVPNLPLAQGHKILINPHFRGNPQPSDGRQAWNGLHQPSGPSQMSNEQFAHPSTSYQNQTSYSQSQSNTQISQEYSNNYSQNKNDDPYAYFSDVWQENKSSKPRSLSPTLKTLLGDSTYSRDNNYKDYDAKYKSDSRDNYHEDQKYRDRSPPSRSRDYSSKSSRSHTSGSSSHHTYDDYRSTNSSSSSRPSTRITHKRTPEPAERSAKDISPKRSKFGSSSRSYQADHRHSSHSHSKNNVQEELDPEMLEYQRKLEAQKRLREKILQEKENRRKQAARQSDNTKEQKTSDTQQSNKSLNSTTNKEIPSDKGSQLNVQTKISSTNAHITEGGEKVTRIVRTIHTADKDIRDNKKKDELMGSSNTSSRNNQLDGQQQKRIVQQSSNRRVVIQKPLSNVQRVVTTISKTVTNLQKPNQQSTALLNTHDAQSTVAHKIAVVQQKNTTNNSGGGTKNVVKEVAKTLRKVIVSNENSANAKKLINSTQNSQRIVLQPNTKLNAVIIENLAASTTEMQIRRMCAGIGKVETITMGERTATIIFKTHSAAMVFQKKYERKMIDLSMINVRLISQSQPNTGQSTNVTIKK